MKFNCGETLDEKIERLSEWHKHFALLPVRISENDCRWLEWVERKAGFEMYLGGCDWTYQYRALSDCDE